MRRADMVNVLLRSGANATLKIYGHTPIERLNDPPNIHWERGAKRVGTDAQITHLLRQSRRKVGINK